MVDPLALRLAPSGRIWFQPGDNVGNVAAVDEVRAGLLLRGLAKAIDRTEDAHGREVPRVAVPVLWTDCLTITRQPELSLR